MSSLCTLYINGKKLGTVISIPRSTDSVTSLKQEITASSSISHTSSIQPMRIGTGNILILSDQNLGPRLELVLVEKKVADEPLRKLSSTMEYIIVTDKVVIYKDNIYQPLGDALIPAICHFKAIPYIKMENIIDYKSTGEIDDVFLREGYAKELKESTHILVPPDWDSFSATCTPYDLLIKKVDGLSNRAATKPIFTHFSERKADIPEGYEIDGRYIHISSIPRFEGICKYPPVTLNMETLFYKYDVLQERLQVYGSNKVDSIYASMRAIAERLKQVPNQFLASSVYDDIVSILDKARSMPL